MHDGIDDFCGGCAKDEAECTCETASVPVQPVVSRFRWPRGRYNGKRIDGFSLRFDVHLLWWVWKPIAEYNHGEPFLLWLCFTIRARARYANRDG